MEVKTEREQILAELREMRIGNAWDWIRRNENLIKNKYSTDVEVVLEIVRKVGGSVTTRGLDKYFAKEVFNNQILYLTLAQDKGRGLDWLLDGIGMSEELKKSEPFLLLMAQTCNSCNDFRFGKIMKSINKELLSQPDFANILVKCAPNSIRYIDESIRKNPKFVAKHISSNPELLTNQYTCLAFDIETLRNAESLLASKYDMNDELSAQIEFAIETIQAEEKRKQQQEQQEKNQRTTFTGYGRVEPVTPTKRGGDNPHRPDVHVAMKTHNGRTITRTM